MKQFLNSYKFKKQHKIFLTYATEIFFKMPYDNIKFLHNRSKGFVAAMILNQSRDIDDYTDKIISTLYDDSDLLYLRNDELTPYAEESFELMDAATLIDDYYLSIAALYIGKLVIKIAKYQKLCKLLNVPTLTSPNINHT